MKGAGTALNMRKKIRTCKAVSISVMSKSHLIRKREIIIKCNDGECKKYTHTVSCHVLRKKILF